MHRTIEITVPPTYTDTLTEELEQLEHVITVSVIRGASIKPPGDVVTVHALNRGADQVMRLAEATRKQGKSWSRRPSCPASSIPSTSGRVTSDVDKALWEEAEIGLRHQSQITANYLGLMALGGAAAASGPLVESTPQATSSWRRRSLRPVSSRSQDPDGLALRRWDVARKGLTSAAAAGYLALALSAALVFLVLRWAGVTMAEAFVGNSQVGELANPTLREIILSVCGALAGMVMLLSYRLNLIPGAPIALMIIEPPPWWEWRWRPANRRLCTKDRSGSVSTFC